LVEIRFTAIDDPELNVKVSRFPAFEMYARLDDGNQVAVFQREPDGGWTGGSLVEVEDELARQCGGKSARVSLHGSAAGAARAASSGRSAISTKAR
jgi:hypothetical protein